MSERDKWIYELGQRHPNLAFDVSDAYIERRGKDKDEIAKLKDDVERAVKEITRLVSLNDNYRNEIAKLKELLSKAKAIVNADGSYKGTVESLYILLNEAAK